MQSIGWDAYAVIMWPHAYSKFSPTLKWTQLPNSPTTFGPHLSNRANRNGPHKPHPTKSWKSGRNKISLNTGSDHLDRPLSSTFSKGLTGPSLYRHGLQRDGVPHWWWAGPYDPIDIVNGDKHLNIRERKRVTSTRHNGCDPHSHDATKGPLFVRFTWKITP